MARHLRIYFFGKDRMRIDPSPVSAGVLPGFEIGNRTARELVAADRIEQRAQAARRVLVDSLKRHTHPKDSWMQGVAIVSCPELVSDDYIGSVAVVDAGNAIWVGNCAMICLDDFLDWIDDCAQIAKERFTARAYARRT